MVFRVPKLKKRTANVNRINGCPLVSDLDGTYSEVGVTGLFYPPQLYGLSYLSTVSIHHLCLDRDVLEEVGSQKDENFNMGLLSIQTIVSLFTLIYVCLRSSFLVSSICLHRLKFSARDHPSTGSRGPEDPFSSNTATPHGRSLPGTYGGKSVRLDQDPYITPRPPFLPTFVLDEERVLFRRVDTEGCGTAVRGGTRDSS